ncbi:hypothetical protein FOZ60_004036 [Perkinsus olseni]|uniref:Uncharacterized protein n=2 Tax=Perkinsus olseni TaxID=32597 RepID=A0A7J6NUX0_PEROL|nr:hypothetical protein FOZ60_004036 [Perkinsus olseni]
MSPKQFIIIGVSAAAALLSNSPLVTAIGSVAHHNTPTDDYPPPDENANFDAKNDAAYCSFNNKRIDEISQSKLLHIDVNGSRIHMRRIHCPKGEKHLPLQLGFFDEDALTWYSIGQGKHPKRQICTFDALPGSFPPESTGLDPFRDLDASTLVDAITDLSSAVRALGRTKLSEWHNRKEETSSGLTLIKFTPADRQLGKTVPKPTVRQYDGHSGLSSYFLGTADDYEHSYSFEGSRTPRNTGRDPIRALKPSTLRSKIDRLYSAVTMIGSTTVLYEDDEESPETEARRFAIVALREVCSAAIPVVKTLGTFKGLCVKYYKESKGAVDVAKKTKGWSVTKTLGVTRISPPDE